MKKTAILLPRTVMFTLKTDVVVAVDADLSEIFRAHKVYFIFEQQYYNIHPNRKPNCMVKSASAKILNATIIYQKMVRMERSVSEQAL